MTKAMHIIDTTTSEDSLRQLQEIAHQDETIVSIGPKPASWVLNRPVVSVPRPFGSGRLAVRRMANLAGGADIIHAWSPGILPAAKLQAEECDLPIVLSVSAWGEDLADRLRATARSGWPFSVTVPSRAARAAFITSGASEEIVRVVPPPAGAIDDREARRRRVRNELSVGERTRLIVVPTEMRRHRGHRIASWAHAVVRQVVEDHMLLMPGGGPLERHVRFFAATTGHNDEVFFTSRRYSPADVLAAADIAAIFCERDGGVAALAGAMAAGLVILGTETPNIAEWAPHEKAALLARPGDTRSASAALLRILDDNDLAGRLAENAQRIAEENFAPNACREKLECIYDALLSTAPV